VRDIAVYLESLELMTADEFIEAAETHDFNYGFLYGLPVSERRYRLEGYLFPDTYYVSADPTPDEVINKMLTRFDEIFTNEYRQQAEDLGLTIDEAIIIASMIEKEVSVETERPLVSQVIHNRLELGMALQIDATVLYALDKRPDRLLLTDLEIDSPYNTYKYGGLPVGPISNPGADSIRAALFPEEGNYLFYVLQDPETGVHFFSDDYQEHLGAQE
jgi:UPF0755 protein